MDSILERTKAYVIIHLGERIDHIFLKGSKAEDVPTDFWSDTDLVIVLKPNTPLDEGIIDHLETGLGNIVAKEVRKSVDQLVLRLVIDHHGGIDLLDLTVMSFAAWKKASTAFQGAYKVVLGEPRAIERIQSTATSHSFSYSDESIDRTWFLFYQCVKKFMRDDHLIGLHLLLELVQEYLVIEMIERDQRYGTTIHRFGYQESIESDLDPRQINYLDNEIVLAYLSRLAFHYDKKLMTWIDHYESRCSIFDRYILHSLSQK